MKISVRNHMDAIAVLEIKGALTRSSAWVDLHAHCQTLVELGKRAVLLDLSACSRTNFSGIAALVELVGTTPELHVAFSGLNGNLTRKLAASGLDRGLYIYPDVAEALKSEQFRRASLCHTHAVILCNQDQDSLWPISKSVPTPMLDVLGMPLIGRIQRQLTAFGLQYVHANPGYEGAQIITHLQTDCGAGAAIRMSNEGFFRQERWIPAVLGGAGSLRQIQERQSAFPDDFFVLQGNSLSNVDLADMMAHHKSCQADITLVAQPRTSADPQTFLCASRSTVQNSTTLLNNRMTFPNRLNGSPLIMSPRVLEHGAIHDQWDIERDFLPALAAAGGKISTFWMEFDSIEFDTPSAYAAVLMQALKSKLPGLLPQPCQRVEAWRSQSAEISQGAQITGQSYIGPKAKLDDGVELHGTCVIGAGAQISGPCVLENCVVFPDTYIASGFWAQNTTLHKDWSFDHRFEPETCLPKMEPAQIFAEAHFSTAQIRKSA